MSEPIDTPIAPAPAVETPPVVAPPVMETPAPEPVKPALPGDGSPLALPSGSDTTSAPSGEDTSTALDLVLPDTEFTLPDGVTVDPEAMGSFREFAIAHKLPKEAAQAALAMHIEALNKSAETFSSAQTQAWNTTIDGWKAELSTIPEFTGDAKDAALSTIGKALDTYGTPGVRDAFALTGAGWNPDIIRTFHAMAKALSEGAPVQAGGPPGGRNRTLAEVLYPPKAT